MTKFYFWSLPLHADSLFQTLCVGSPHICKTIILTVKSLMDMVYFFTGNCKCFYPFSTKYRLDNYILNFKKLRVLDLPVVDILKKGSF